MRSKTWSSQSVTGVRHRSVGCSMVNAMVIATKLPLFQQYQISKSTPKDKFQRRSLSSRKPVFNFIRLQSIVMNGAMTVLVLIINYASSTTVQAANGHGQLARHGSILMPPAAATNSMTTGAGALSA